MKKEEKSLSEMTVDELKSESISLAKKQAKYEKISSGALKSLRGALALAVATLGLMIGCFVFDVVTQTKLDNENEQGLAAFLDEKEQKLLGMLDRKEINEKEFSKLKEMAEENYKEEYYTAFAPEETKEQYQTYSEQNFAMGMSMIAGAAAAGAYAAVSATAMFVADDKKEKADQKCVEVVSRLKLANCK